MHRKEEVARAANVADYVLKHRDLFTLTVLLVTTNRLIIMQACSITPHVKEKGKGKKKETHVVAYSSSRSLHRDEIATDVPVPHAHGPRVGRSQASNV